MQLAKCCSPCLTRTVRSFDKCDILRLPIAHLKHLRYLHWSATVMLQGSCFIKEYLMPRLMILLLPMQASQPPLAQRSTPLLEPLNHLRRRQRCRTRKRSARWKSCLYYSTGSKGQALSHPIRIQCVKPCRRLRSVNSCFPPFRRLGASLLL
jgi:hypothetical protein